MWNTTYVRLYSRRDFPCVTRRHVNRLVRACAEDAAALLMDVQRAAASIEVPTSLLCFPILWLFHAVLGVGVDQ